MDTKTEETIPLILIYDATFQNSYINLQSERLCIINLRLE